MNVSISALNSSMVAMCYCGTGFARYNGMSLKVDGCGGGDGSKNQLQLGGSTPRSNIIISILRQHVIKHHTGPTPPSKSAKTLYHTNTLAFF